MEVTMLRWTNNVKYHDHVKKNDIRDRSGVATILEKL